MSTPAFFDIEKEKSFNAEFQFPRVTFCCKFESDIEIMLTRLKRAQFGKLVARAFEHRTNDFFEIEYFDPEFFLQTTFLLVVSNFASDICQHALMRAQFNIESPKTRGARI